jgi:hypothetical protein
MNGSMKFLCAGALLASSTAFADPHISVNINPFGWGAPPPVVYEPPRYAPPPVVYYGGGRWGDHHDRYRGRDHRDGHRDDHRDGDHRR